MTAVRSKWALLAAGLAVACQAPGVEVHQPSDVDATDIGVPADAGVALDAAPSPDDAAATDVDPVAEDSGVRADVEVGAPDTGQGAARSAGCLDGDGLAEGEHTFTLDGRERRYILRLPSGYTRDRAWPLVLALHGNGGSAAYWDGTSGTRNIRAVLAEHAVLIVAEAIEGNWRDYAADPATWPARVESELLYFDSVLEEARRELCIDNEAVFSMGFSGGGSFSGVLGCRRTDIRAIAVGGSVLYFDPAECVGNPAAWITIGELELAPAREQFRDFWRDRAGCAATSTATEPAPCTAYDACAAPTPVHYCEHPGDHIWPDFGSQAMWDFFAQFVD